MRAKLIRESTKGFPARESWEDDDIPMEGFTLGRFYEVITLYQVKNRCHLLTVDDKGRLSSRLAYCFELEDQKIPEDWIVNIVNDHMTIIIGPEFIASSYNDLANLIQYDKKMTDKLKDYYMSEAE